MLEASQMEGCVCQISCYLGKKLQYQKLQQTKGQHTVDCSFLMMLCLPNITYVFLIVTANNSNTTNRPIYCIHYLKI